MNEEQTYLCGGAVGSLVEAPLGIVVVMLVEPDVLGREALHSTHVGTGGGGREKTNYQNGYQTQVMHKSDPVMWINEDNC